MPLATRLPTPPRREEGSSLSEKRVRSVAGRARAGGTPFAWRWAVAALTGQHAHSSCALVGGAQRKDSYARRGPEDTALYQCVSSYFPEFRERMHEQGGLPKFVEQEFQAYLGCGRVEAGCLELQCRSCGHSQLVALSCKRRGFCASCLGRRMSDTAVHLEQEVLPEVPVRHWVCSFPWGVRAVLGYDKELCREAVRAFAKELSRSLKHRAKRELGLSGVDDALTGLVVVVQRTDGALRLNVHLHVLALDGVYVEDEQGELGFHALGTASSAEVADIARRTARRLHRAFQKQGRISPWDDEHAFVDSGDTDPFSLDEPGLFACYQAAASGIAVSAERAAEPVLRLLVQSPKGPERSTDDERADQPVAEALGVNLYAKQLVDGRDRKQLERLCRYVMRPPLSQERLEWRTDGRLELTLKNVWKDGTRALVLEPFDLLVRLCSAIPPPWFNMVRYFGVLSSHSRHRARVVPRQVDPERFAPPAAAGDQLELGYSSGETNSAVRTSGRSRWGGRHRADCHRKVLADVRPGFGKTLRRPCRPGRQPRAALRTPRSFHTVPAVFGQSVASTKLLL
jgi:Putative transposase/Transposase zinc-binding domain